MGQAESNGYAAGVEMQRELAESRESSPDPKSLEAYHGHAAGNFDHTHHSVAYWGTFGLVRAESMDLVNDPRFFTSNVLEKRLAAFAFLSAISTFLLVNSMKQMYALKKDQAFGWNEAGMHAVFQTTTFLIMMLVTYSMAVSAFIKTHQIFFCYRLLTAGPMGIEQAIMFYMNRTITMWRHFAFKMIMNGMIWYVVGSGGVLCMKFIKDAEEKEKTMGIGQLVLTAQVNASMLLNKKAIAQQYDLHPKELPLDIHVHTAMAVGVMLAFTCFSCHLSLIRRQHIQCFQEHYRLAYDVQHHLLAPSRAMALRSGAWIET